MIIDDVILKHGAPQVILSDRGKSFRTAMMRAIYDEFAIRHVTATAYHPQTNGLTERLNKTLAIMLSMYVNKYHNDWDEYLPYVAFAYNTTVQQTTGYTPFYLLYGVEARLLFDDDGPEAEVAGHYEKLHEARELAIARTRSAQSRQKASYDQGRYTQEFEVGDLVLVHRARGYTGQTTKLRHPYEGPFEIIAKNSDLNYLVKDVSGTRRSRKAELVHVSRLKKYSARADISDDEH